MLSDIWLWHLMMRQQAKLMTVMTRAGFVTTSFHCERKGKVVASMKVVPSAELLDILMRASKHWNMEKIMMVTGQGNFHKPGMFFIYCVGFKMQI